jgi:hypothetical protein
LSLVFFTDRDLGKQFPEILRSSVTVERHQDHFAPNASDETWLEEVGKRGWVALTHDRRIRSKPNELAAVMRNGVALLVIIGKAPHPELARSFVVTFPRVQRFVASHTHRPTSPRFISLSMIAETGPQIFTEEGPRSETRTDGSARPGEAGRGCAAGASAGR